MSELKSQANPPRWVLDLNSPPPYRSKANGIPDPPGYPSQAPTSKVCRRPVVVICRAIAD